MSGSIDLTSTESDGQGNGGSDSPSLSANGREVALAHDASNLATDVTNNASDVLVEDPATDELSLTRADTTIGSGPDMLVLKIAQDAFQGDAQFTVSVDGQQIDGTLTADALHNLGQDDTTTVLGNWASGPHTVTVNFLNDAYGGTPDTDRNLYVDGMTLNGVLQPNTTAVLLSAGPESFGVTRQGPTTTTIGSGPFQFVLKVSQDAYQGDAQFTVGVDGQQIDGTLTAAALHSTGRDDTITVQGYFATQPHTVTVNFLNDAYGGTPDTDRNLYVDAITYYNVPQTDGTAALYSAGPQSFSLGAPTPANTTIGSGPDRLVLVISQDAYQGDAQYMISVDGQQVGGTLTASALHGLYQDDTVTVLGDWSAGQHTVTVNYLNDAYAGAPDTDRNLYVDSIYYDGDPVPGGTAALNSAGPANFTFTDVGTLTAGAITLTPQNVPAAQEIGGIDPNAPPTINLQSASLGSLTMPTGLPQSPGAVYPPPEYATVNVSGSSRIGDIAIGNFIGINRAPVFGHPPLGVADNLTVNLAVGADLTTSFDVKWGSTLNVHGGSDTSLVADASILEGGKAIIDAPLIGGSILLSNGPVDPGSTSPGSLELDGSVGSGVTISIGVGQLSIDNLATFLGTVSFSGPVRPGGQGPKEVLLKGLDATSFRFDDANHTMTFVSGSDVTGQLHFASDVTTASFSNGPLYVSHTADGVYVDNYGAGYPTGAMVVPFVS